MPTSRRIRNKKKAKIRRKKKEASALAPQFLHNQAAYTWKSFLKEHAGAVLIIGAFLASLAAAFFLNKNQGDPQATQALMNSNFKKSLPGYSRKYKNGYAVYEVSPTSIKTTSFDNLPKHLSNLARRMSLDFIKPNQFTGEPPKIKISVPVSLNVADSFLTPYRSTVIFREKGKTSSLGDINNFNVYVEIIEDYGTGIFLLIGAR